MLLVFNHFLICIHKLYVPFFDLDGFLVKHLPNLFNSV